MTNFCEVEGRRECREVRQKTVRLELRQREESELRFASLASLAIKKIDTL